MMASMGVDDPDELSPHHLMRRVDHVTTRSYAELYEWLEPGELLDGDAAARAGRADWARASPDSFACMTTVAETSSPRSPTRASRPSGASSATR